MAYDAHSKVLFSFSDLKKRKKVNQMKYKNYDPKT